MGVGFATQPLVANCFGAQDDSGVKNQLQQSLWLCLLMGIVCTFSVLLVAFGLGQMELEPKMLDVALNYMLVMSLCAVPFCLAPALRGTLEGMNFTPVVFVVVFSAFLINIPLDYVLVNGLYGFPKLGGVGCAWASAILVWLMATAMGLILYLHPKIKHRKLFSAFAKPEKNALLKTWRLGFPIGLAIFIELSMFCGAGMLIAFFGPVEVSAHAVAITIASLSFMLYNGLAQGVTIRASQFLGAARPGRAVNSVKVGIGFNIAISFVFCVLFLVFNEPLVRLFTQDPEVIVLAVVLLYFAAAFQVVDCLQVAVVYALRAYQDTVTPPKVMFVGFFIVGIPIGLWFGFYAGIPQLAGAKGLWLGMVSGLLLVGVLLLHHLRKMIKSFDLDKFEADEWVA